MKREMENIKKNQMKLLGMKNSFWREISLDKINSQFDTAEENQLIWMHNNRHNLKWKPKNSVIRKKNLPQSFDELWEILKCNWSPSMSGRKIILRNNAENHPDLQSSMNPKQGKHKECHIKAHYHQIAAVWW